MKADKQTEYRLNNFEEEKIMLSKPDTSIAFEDENSSGILPPYGLDYECNEML